MSEFGAETQEAPASADTLDSAICFLHTDSLPVTPRMFCGGSEGAALRVHKYLCSCDRDRYQNLMPSEAYALADLPELLRAAGRSYEGCAAETLRSNDITRTLASEKSHLARLVLKTWELLREMITNVEASVKESGEDETSDQPGYHYGQLRERTNHLVNRVESKAIEAAPPGFQHENHPFAVTSYIDNPKSGSGILSERERQHRMNHGWMCGFDYTNLRSAYDPVKTYKDIQAFWKSFEICGLQMHPVCTRALRDELRGGVDELSVANRDDDDVKVVSEAIQRHIHYQLMPDANGEGDGGAVRRHLDSPTEVGRIIHFCHVLQVTTLMVRHHELQAAFSLMDATEGTMWSFGFASVVGAAVRSSVNGYSPHYADAPRVSDEPVRVTLSDNSSDATNVYRSVRQEESSSEEETRPNSPISVRGLTHETQMFARQSRTGQDLASASPRGGGSFFDMHRNHMQGKRRNPPMSNHTLGAADARPRSGIGGRARLLPEQVNQIRNHQQSLIDEDASTNETNDACGGYDVGTLRRTDTSALQLRKGADQYADHGCEKRAMET
eukprot:COSAG06_NODE_2219_length_7322_cov_15.813789_1_plen_556_part_10